MYIIKCIAVYVYVCVHRGHTDMCFIYTYNNRFHEDVFEKKIKKKIDVTTLFFGKKKLYGREPNILFEIL